MAFELFVNGTLMRGLALNRNLEGATFLGDVHPSMYEVAQGGLAVAGELYRVPDDVWTWVEAGEPPNLYRGKVRLEDCRTVWGVLYPQELAEGIHPDISEHGDWRRYMNERSRA